MFISICGESLRWSVWDNQDPVPVSASNININIFNWEEPNHKQMPDIIFAFGYEFCLYVVPQALQATGWYNPNKETNDNYIYYDQKLTPSSELYFQDINGIHLIFL